MTLTDSKKTPLTFVWGKLKRTIPNIGLFSVRGEMDANEREMIDLDIQASGFGTGLKVTGSART